MSLTLPACTRGRRRARGTAVCSSASLRVRVDNNKRKIASRGERNSEGLFLLSSGSGEDQKSRRLIFLSFSRLFFDLSIPFVFLPTASALSGRSLQYLVQRRGGQERSSDASAIQHPTRYEHLALDRAEPLSLPTQCSLCDRRFLTAYILFCSLFCSPRRGRAKSDCLDSFVRSSVRPSWTVLLVRSLGR